MWSAVCKPRVVVVHMHDSLGVLVLRASALEGNWTSARPWLAGLLSSGAVALIPFFFVTFLLRYLVPVTAEAHYLKLVERKCVLCPFTFTPKEAASGTAGTWQVRSFKGSEWYVCMWNWVCEFDKTYCVVEEFTLPCPHDLAQCVFVIFEGTLKEKSYCVCVSKLPIPKKGHSCRLQRLGEPEKLHSTGGATTLKFLH